MIKNCPNCHKEKSVYTYMSENPDMYYCIYCRKQTALTKENLEMGVHFCKICCVEADYSSKGYIHNVIYLGNDYYCPSCYDEHFHKTKETCNNNLKMNDKIKSMKQECLKFLEENIITLKNKNQELHEELEFIERFHKLFGQELTKLKSEIKLNEDLIEINQNIYNKKLLILQREIEEHFQLNTQKNA